MVTRDDVAKLAQVSPSTVSYVVNNGPRPVSAETREKVLKAIKELGYHPNAVARNLRRQQTNSLGLIIPDIVNSYFADLTKGVEDTAFDRDYTVSFCHTAYSLDRELRYVDHLYSERTAGVIWVPATGDPSPALRLREYEIPLVILDRNIHNLKAPSVVGDNFSGGYMATEHLISLGHRRIGCIARPVRLSHSQERVKGYTKALEDHGLPLDEKLIAPGGYRFENGSQAIDRLLSLEDPPTAVFAYNDIMAIGALRRLKEKGYRVPEDFSVVGFDDIPESSFTCPALTTIRQPKLEMGRKAADFLLDLIDGKQLGNAVQSMFEVVLVVRETTGPVPN